MYRNLRKTKDNYNYTGVEDCEMMAFIPGGGSKACNYGCMGFGSCVKACPFDAIHIVNGVAVVDREACKACGKCIAKCPHHLIELAPYDQKHLLAVALMQREKPLQLHVNSDVSDVRNVKNMSERCNHCYRFLRSH